MSNKEKDTKAYLKSNVKSAGERLLRNKSKGEQAFFLSTVILAATALILSAVMAIMSGDAVTIVRAFTENVVFFVLIVALTISDRFLVFRGKRLTLIIYALVSLARDVFGVIGKTGAGMVLGIFWLVAGVVLYGTLIFDQLVRSNESDLKYWLIYGGVAYKSIYSLINMIIVGMENASSGVVVMLHTVVSGLSTIMVLLMLVYFFDKFSFAVGKFHEIVDDELESEDADVKIETEDHTPKHIPEKSAPEGTVKVEPKAAKREDDEYVSLDDLISGDTKQTAPSTDKTAPKMPEVTDEPNEPDEPSESVEESVLDDTKYASFDDPSTEDIDPSVVSVVNKHDKTADYSKEPTVIEGEDEIITIIDPDVEDLPQDVPEDNEPEDAEALENAEKEAPVADAPTDTEKLVNDESADHTNTSEPQDEPEALPSLLEIKYARFAIVNHKPDETERVVGLLGDVFDVWVDEDIICFQNDYDQVVSGSGLKIAMIPFDAVRNISLGEDGAGGECIVLEYERDGVLRGLCFKKESFPNFKRVIMKA